MNDSQKRAVRGLVQAVPAALLISGWNLFLPPAYHANAEQAAWLTVVLGAIFSYVMNRLEDSGAVGPLLYRNLTAKRNPWLTPDGEAP